MATTWTPLGDQLVSTWWPLGDHLVTTWWPLGDHLVSLCCICTMRLNSIWWNIKSSTDKTLERRRGWEDWFVHLEPNWFPDHRYSCTAITSLHVDTYKDTLPEKNAKIILGNEIGGSQLQAVTTCYGVTLSSKWNGRIAFPGKQKVAQLNCTTLI